MMKFINNPDDLKTSHEAIKEGFLQQALLKNENASPYVARAKLFYNALDKVTTIEELIHMKDFWGDVVCASGFSDKSKAKLNNSELEQSIRNVWDKVIGDPSINFREEIIYRYLLTKGDALGGRMRNVTGALAGTKLSTVILNKLGNSDVQILRKKSGKVQRIIWGNRILLFDVKPAIVNKNIDVILINSTQGNLSEKELLKQFDCYLACGELKGGIDPAGADEHWKTANSALGRIRDVFTHENITSPKLFFIGAAIEASMAGEIFQQLADGRLNYAANLNNSNQLGDLVEWLISL